MYHSGEVKGGRRGTETRVPTETIYVNRIELISLVYFSAAAGVR